MAKTSFLEKLLRQFIASSAARSKTIPAKRQAKVKTSPFFDYLEDVLEVDSNGRQFIGSEGSFDFDIVGESHYQEALERFAGGRSETEAKVEILACILPENNPKDKNAVVVKINGETVGYLAKAHAKAWRAALRQIRNCEDPVEVMALIVGGWHRTPKGKPVETGSFGLKLDMSIDFDE